MKFIDYILNNKKINNICNKIFNANNYKRIYISNSSDNYSKFIAANYFLKTNKTIVYLTKNIYHASTAYDVLLDLVGEEYVSFFPVEEFVTLNSIASSNVYRLARMQTLERIIKNKPQIIVTSTEGAIRNVLSIEKLKESILYIYKNMEYSKEKLINDLIVRGYKKQIITETQGSFSVRGEVLDIFPINCDEPIRLNYFDNEIEEIRTFRVDTQLTIDKLDDMYIYPLNEIYYQDANSVIDSIKEVIGDNEYTNSLFNSIENYDNLDKLYIYLPFIDCNYSNFLDIIKDKDIFIEEYNDVINKEISENNNIDEFLREKSLDKFKIFKKSIKNINSTIENNKIIFINKYHPYINGYQLDENINCNTIDNIDYKNNFKNLLDNIEANYKEKTFILTSSDEKRLLQFKYSLDQRKLEYRELSDNILHNNIYIAAMENAYGYIDLDEKLEFITPNDYAKGTIEHISRYQQYYKNSVKIYNKDELDVGDYIVHEKYGIGKYLGIKTDTIGGRTNDYLVILYEDDVKVHILVENIHTIEKYISTSGKEPKLSSFKKRDWTKKKAKVQKEVAELAQRLIKVEQERANKKGYIYPKDDEYQIMFEKDFGFIETNDQLKAVADVKQDLENGRLMDRILCGDVGFGKTEVAMRAAFKVVYGGKQVAYLAPTTVLSRQHYYTFKERFEKYGVKVDLINRFVSDEKQKEIISNVKSGYTEILIGTHRLLSKEVKFKDLGLLIIDEEQRFGVEQKEKLKELKTDIDVLSLSATPIPRTLQMGLVGVKDLSLIETPPVNRFPVQTYVLESNESIIREAINKELSRNGQVFYLLNRIDQLSSIVKKVNKLVPEAKVGVIHGRLTRDDVEVVIDSFINREINVLICTTIIETGIDIPNANTLIVERADILGLSQLYQLRGRVGRSDKIAYAYFLYNPGQTLSEDSEKRLNTIKEFTSLGSGYKIAMRDLTIRGAGDILGKEQSGFIDDIGINTYIKILNEEVKKQKGIINEDDISTYKVEMNHHIDALYVGDDALRIEMHKQISKVRNRDQIRLLINQYNDRFGSVPEDIVLYIEAKYFEYLLVIKQVETFKEKFDNVYLEFSIDKSKEFFSKSTDVELNKLFKNIKISINKNRVTFELKRSDFDKSYIYTMTKILERL